MLAWSHACAQDRKFSPLPNFLPLGTEACFGRIYDAEHLRRHPKQRITSFHILRDFAPDQDLETETSSREDMLNRDGTDGFIDLTTYVRLRDRDAVYSNYFRCHRGEGGVVQCGIECDGGSFALRPSRGALVVENQGFVVIGGCGASDEQQDNAVYVQRGVDDKTFRLNKRPLLECAALQHAQRPIWAKLGRRLRERFAAHGALCLTRAYDAAHLAAHPQQTVKRIAVLKIAVTSDHSPPQYNLLFRAELKDGQRMEAKTNCWPDGYAYACTHDMEVDAHPSFYLTRAADGVMLRDRKGNLGALFKSKLGSDDKMFRLAASPASACEF
jgi:hypothetical protein